MLFLSLLASVALFSGATASPLDVSHTIHERRSVPPKGWKKRDILDRRAVLPMRIGLKQQNLDKTWEWLSSVSHPGSESYGQHWTAKEVAEAFAPSKESVTAIKAWLTSAGIPHESITHSQSLNWLTFPATVADAERLLNTTYHVYQHEMSGTPHVACDAYSIPNHLLEHVDIISPTVHFDAKIHPRSDGAALSTQQAVPNKSPGMPGSGSLPKGGFVMDMGKTHPDMNDLKNCDAYITPACLRALYQLPINKATHPANSLGVVEYTPQAYLAADLDHFFANYTPAAVGQRPILASIDGGVVQTTNKSFNFNGESNLDLQYAMALAYPQRVTLYQAGDLIMGASFNNFLDAIDGSYCTYDGGDDPAQDGIYPDRNATAAAGAYTGPETCGGYAATKVISTSYSSDEHDLTPRYAQRQCAEYAKLGLMGVSVLYSSGDYGVAGERGECLNGTGADAPYIRNATSGRFTPSFPGTCPYVISVGATQVRPNVTVGGGENMASRVQVEEACETVIYSGGGFSDMFAMPEYQASAVGRWFADYPPPYGADRFNNSRAVRGYPDVSANGANYVVSVVGNFSRVYGTSASTPTFAAILTLINQERLSANKSTVGFINPVAYAHPEVFNDITAGGNQGCGTKGFSSAPGWDPVTGLGTPNYPKMLDLWMSLD